MARGRKRTAEWEGTNAVRARAAGAAVTVDERRRALGLRDGAAALVLAVTIFVTGSVRTVPGVVGAFHDDAVYVVTAKALAEGEGYRLINLPGAPPQTKYPVLYPAVLALVWKAVPTFEARLGAMKIVTLLLAALALASGYLYVVRFGYADRWPAFAAGLLCAFAPNLLYYASQVLSEMPFALLLVAALWAIEVYVRAPQATAPAAWLCGVAAALPFLCRSAGVVVPAVAIMSALVARRPVRWVIAGIALVAVPWVVWMARGIGGMAADPVVGYQQDYLGHWSTGYFGYTSRSPLLLALEIFAANVLKAFAAVGEIPFEAVARALYARTEWTRPLMIAVGALAWLVAAARVRALTPLHLTLVAYLLLACSWPWPPDRFMVPVLFFLHAGLLTAAARVATRRVSRRAGAAAVAAIAALAILPNARLLAEYSAVSKRSHYPYFVLPDATVTWSSYEDAFAWLREHASPGDVLAAGFDSMTALYTGHPVIRPFVARPSSMYYGGTAPMLGTPRELADALTLHRPRYLFVSPLPAFPEEDAFFELVQSFLAAYPGRLEPAYLGSDARFAIFAVRPIGE